MANDRVVFRSAGFCCFLATSCHGLVIRLYTVTGELAGQVLRGGLVALPQRACASVGLAPGRQSVGVDRHLNAMCLVSKIGLHLEGMKDISRGSVRRSAPPET